MTLLGKLTQKTRRENFLPRSLGISLLEVMLVIAVSAIAFLMAINYYTNVKSSNSVNRGVQEVNHLYQGTLSYYKLIRYQSLKTSATDLTTELVNGNYISQNDLKSSFGSGQNTVAMSLSTTNNSNKILITMATVPAKACIILKNRLTASLPNNTTFSNCPTTGSGNLLITIPL